MSATVAQYPIDTSTTTACPRERIIHSVDGSVHIRVATVPSEYVAFKQHTANERIALVLDMDECLVHSKFENENVEYRQEEYRPKQQEVFVDSFEIIMEDGEKAIVNKRPGLDHFLEQASKHYDLYVFTAGLESYGKPILDQLDPKGTLFKGRFFRQSCKSMKGMFLKDLSCVQRDLSRVILVDNNPVSFLLQPSNGIPVPSFYDDVNDRTLDSLWQVLHSLKELKDVRPKLHQLFRLADLLAEHQRAILSAP
jgi:Dullard-like phosphatase family protein